MPGGREDVSPRPGPIIAEKRNRLTHSTIQLYDCGHPDAEFGVHLAGWRWATICVTHATIQQHRTRRLALLHMAAPHGWCAACAASLSNQ